MRMKTFQAANSTAAFAKVKAELGEDAVILSNKTITQDGIKCCEVVAAIESAPVKKTAHTPQTREGFIESAMSASVGWQREWSQIKGQIMQLMKPQMDMSVLTPKQKRALEYLEREDVDENVLAQLYCTLRDKKDLGMLAALDTLLTTRPFGEDFTEHKFHAFAGPGGVGKTSSLVRLALQEKKRRPHARICLATADGGRGKGRLVLKHYAELSGLAFREIITRDDFTLLHKEANQFDLILIDLPGLSGQSTLLEWTSLYGLAGCKDLIIHLVLNPYYSTQQFTRFIEKYKSEQLASVIWTKLDETCTFGAVLNMAFACGLPVSALSFGSGLKKSIEPATSEKIWRLLFMRQLPNGDIQP